MSPHRAGMRQVVILAALLVLTGSCGPNPAQPSSLAGTWTGMFVSNLLGNVPLQLTLAQSGSSISGTFAQSPPAAASSSGSALTGTLSGSAVTIALTIGTCTRTLTGTWSGITMSGSYKASGTCGNLDSGTFSLTLE